MILEEEMEQFVKENPEGGVTKGQARARNFLKTWGILFHDISTFNALARSLASVIR